MIDLYVLTVSINCEFDASAMIVIHMRIFNEHKLQETLKYFSSRIHSQLFINKGIFF